MNKTINRFITIVAFVLVSFYIFHVLTNQPKKVEQKSQALYITKPDYANTQNSSSDDIYKNTNNIVAANNYSVNNSNSTINGNANGNINNSTNSNNNKGYSNVQNNTVNKNTYINTTNSVSYSKISEYKNKVSESEMVYYTPVIKYIKNEILSSNIFDKGLYDIFIEKIDLKSKYINAAVVFYPQNSNTNSKTGFIDGYLIVLTLYVERKDNNTSLSLLSVIKDDHTVDFFNVFNRSVYKFSVVKNDND
ncbi:hypothetical protein ACAG39_08340 [Caldicellulosiruptoraceae bacterium PP1]